MSRPIRSIILQSEVRSYPKNVPIFFIYRSFEGVEALEGHEKVPANIQDFSWNYTIFLDFLFLAYSIAIPNFLEICDRTCLKAAMELG
jgi:hypothetical protein